jgi:hypothetical protein
MGLFDRTKNLTSEFEQGQEFLLHSIDHVGVSDNAEYGERPYAEVTVSPVEAEGDRTTYAVYGVLADQARRAEDGDLPAIVRLGKDKRANVFEFVGKPEDRPPM